MKQILYFSYGSNMLRERILARCKSARVISVAKANGFTIEFSKKSTDCSGKATIVKSAIDHSVAYGVIFEIDECELSALDKYEGLGCGYDRVDSFDVELIINGVMLPVSTYIASPKYVDRSLKPYDWYKALIIAGSLQNKLDPDYIDILRSYPHVWDKQKHRTNRIKALDVMQQAGFHEYRALLRG